MEAMIKTMSKLEPEADQFLYSQFNWKGKPLQMLQTLPHIPQILTGQS